MQLSSVNKQELHELYYQYFALYSQNPMPSYILESMLVLLVKLSAAVASDKLLLRDLAAEGFWNAGVTGLGCILLSGVTLELACSLAG